MNDILKNIFKFLILSIATIAIFNFIGSEYLVNYLKNNLLTIQLGTFAINLSIFSFIISRAQEIKKEYKDFDTRSIILSLKESLVEQIVILIIGIFLLSMYDSKLAVELFDVTKFHLVLDVLIVSVFYNTLQIFYDTGNGLFLLIDSD